MPAPTAGDPFKAKIVSDDVVDAAVEVLMRDPTVSPDWTEKHRRGVVRTPLPP